MQCASAVVAKARRLSRIQAVWYWHIMSSRPARSSDVAAPRVLVLDGGTPRDVFDVLGAASPASPGQPSTLRVRSAYLFEVGEELNIRIEQDGNVSEAVARVKKHLGHDEARITELEILERS